MNKLLATVIILSALAPYSHAIDWSGQGDAGYNQSSGELTEQNIIINGTTFRRTKITAGWYYPRHG